MTLEEKGEKAIKKLLELTQENNIRWDRLKNTFFLTRGTDDVIDAAYIAQYNKSRFLIYEVRYQCMDMDERSYWDNDIRVDMVDIDAILIWRLPKNRMMWDLMKAVRIKAGNAEQVIDEFLKD